MARSWSVLAWLTLAWILIGESPASPLAADETANPPATADDSAPAAAPANPAPADQATPPAKEGDADQPEAEPLAGHSAHGEVFNEGPRQKAYLMGTCGPAVFNASTENELARQFIDQGFNQLHGFWYFESERSFRQAAALDGECPIAYLGMALSNLRNTQRAKGFLQEALERRDRANDREKAYLDAYKEYIEAEEDKEKRKGRTDKLIKALDEIALKYPDDLEAKAQLALQLYNNRSGDGASYLAANALMDEILSVEPRHPVHHYKIHLWDNKKPERALPSAALCGPSAPGIAHMWHMPGHIYSRLKRYQDAVWQQEASARVDHAHMMRDRVLPDQIHNFAHNNEWLIRNLVHIGKASAGLDLAKNMLELPRHPKYNTLEQRGCSASYGRLRLFEVLSKFEMWPEVLELAETMYLEPTDIAEQRALRERLLGRSYEEMGRIELADETLRNCEQELQRLEAEEREKKTAAERNELKKLVGEKDRPPAPWTEEQKKGLEKAVSDAVRDLQNDLKHWRRAVDELQGRRLVREGNLAEGLKQLRKASGVDPLELARLEFASGEQEKALKAAASEVKSHEGEVLPLACQVELLFAAGRESEAREAFDQLRKISSDIDLARAPFQRLQPIVAAWDLPPDWREKSQLADDLGPRPDLNTLGPFRWRPSAAPEWELPQGNGELLSYKAYVGRPYVLVFYLGYGCLHCAEQLHKFAPRMDDLRAQGLELVAVSSDNLEGLQRSQEDYSGGELPFPLVSDESLEVFKAYRAYDDFEQASLHGTFLIDADGNVRWQDISYEPFMDVDFLLRESERLLKQTPQ